MRTPEEFEAAKAAIKKEYGDLPDTSFFGGDNRGSERICYETLERLGKCKLDFEIDAIEDDMYDGQEENIRLESGYSAGVQLCMWARGEQEEPLGI